MRGIISAVISLVVLIGGICSGADEETIELGIIGLDTSHVVAFTGYINDPENQTGCKVVAAYKGGSADIPASADRIDQFTRKLVDEYDVELTETIEALCRRVDGILLMSVDGRTHLEQVKPVIAAGKPVFVDKPMADSLAEVIEIFRLAQKNNVPCWSSSSLRFSPPIAEMAHSEAIGEVMGCEAYSPCTLEEHHPDLYWYGIHGVETLFTIMGPGCGTVRRTSTEGTDLVTGVWKDGRIGSFRGIRQGKRGYGAMVYGSKGNRPSGQFTGYEGLCKEIIRFFKTKKPPISPEETIEIYAFMTAADESKKQDGASISVKAVIAEAKEKVDRKYSAEADKD